MRATYIALGVAILVFALMAAAIGFLVVENSRLAAQVEQTAAEAGQYRSTVTVLLEQGSHFAVTDGWSGEPHVEPVKQRGAGVCFDCHQETDCSDCHTDKD